MTKGYMYILLCADGSYYTGSTINLLLRLEQHKSGAGANHTKKNLPVTLVYYEEFERIDDAFFREKQIQGWSRKKKEALIEKRQADLPLLSRNYTQYGDPETGVSTSSITKPSTGSTTKLSTGSTTEFSPGSSTRSSGPTSNHSESTNSPQ